MPPWAHPGLTHAPAESGACLGTTGLWPARRPGPRLPSHLEGPRLRVVFCMRRMYSRISFAGISKGAPQYESAKPIRLSSAFWASEVDLLHFLEAELVKCGVLRAGDEAPLLPTSASPGVGDGADGEEPLLVSPSL
jgi:hypothetical protein